MKKYIAKTSVSINVVLASGTNRHVAFDAVTGGGSVFYTNDEELQKAIESHYKFGKLFRIDSEFAKANAKVNVASDDDDETEETDSEGEEGEGNAEGEAELQTVVVTDADAAKAYLADHFGISRTKLKSVAKIKAEAAANGIVFEGI